MRLERLAGAVHPVRVAPLDDPPEQALPLLVAQEREVMAQQDKGAITRSSLVP